MRNQERGASYWPFIISLVLLLGFVFLWYGAKGEADQLRQEKEGLQKRISNDDPANKGLQQQLTDWESYADEVSTVVGFQGYTMPGHTKPLTDVKAVSKALLDQPGSEFGDMKAAATVMVSGNSYKPKVGVQATNPSIAQLPDGFKNKVREVKAAEPGPPPPQPTDTDDAGAMAQYQADKAAWLAKVKKYSDLMDELVKMPAFKDYGVVLGETMLYDPDKPGIFPWIFWDRPAASVSTLEDFVKIPAPILRFMRQSYADAVNADKGLLDGKDVDIGKLRILTDNEDAANPGLKQQLAAEQAAHTAETGRLQAEAATARADLEKIRVSENGAQAALAQEKESHKKDGEKSNQTISAYENRAREDKEKRDIEIQRDDPDGTLLGVDLALGTGHVDLGSQDHVYPGLRFDVSAVGRGGARVMKGTVVVTKVLDAHYSQVRVVAQAFGERPLASRDIIANPFYSKSKPIHAYVAGDLRKYPQGIAIARLQEMGVVIDSAVGAATDWIVVPDSMSVSPTPTAAADASAAGGAKEESMFDKLAKLAKTFGATLLTERMVEHFLGY